MKQSPAQRALAQRTKQEMITGKNVSRSWGKRGKRTLAAKKRAHVMVIDDRPVTARHIIAEERHEEPTCPLNPIAAIAAANKISIDPTIFLPEQIRAEIALANSYFDPVIIPRWKALELGLEGVTYGK